MGSLAHVAVELCEGVSVITGGQFSIQYPPDALRLVGIAPGAECDLSSPFALEVYEHVDRAVGRVDYAVIVDAAMGGVGTPGPASLACALFEVVGEVPDNSVCLFDGGNPLPAVLSDEHGVAIAIDNSLDCPPELPLPILSCGEVVVSPTCECEEGTPDCGAYSGDCSEGFCDEALGRCVGLPINEGGACDDGDSCTTVDTCEDGVCVGTGCPHPSLCIDIEDECQLHTGWMEVRIELGEGDSTVVGGQFAIEYDPAHARFIDASPGRLCDPTSPFVTEIYEEVNESMGKIFYAAGVSPLGGDEGTSGPSTLACLTFQYRGMYQSEICIMEGVNPRTTILSDDHGIAAPFRNVGVCEEEPPAIACDDTCTPIPTVSHWGLIVLALLLLIAGKARFGGMRE